MTHPEAPYISPSWSNNTMLSRILTAVVFMVSSVLEEGCSRRLE